MGRLEMQHLTEAFSQSTARLSFITEELQAAGLRARMVPIDTVFRKFPRLVRDVAHNLKKEVDLLVSGEDTELDKTMVEMIGDPLVHLVRNSLDHGLELPDVRESGASRAKEPSGWKRVRRATKSSSAWPTTAPVLIPLASPKKPWKRGWLRQIVYEP